MANQVISSRLARQTHAVLDEELAFPSSAMKEGKLLRDDAVLQKSGQKNLHVDNVERLCDCSSNDDFMIMGKICFKVAVVLFGLLVLLSLCAIYRKEVHM